MFVNIKDFKMKKLNRTRDITVYLPDNYFNEDKRYPVIYIQDGQNAFFDATSFSGVSWGFIEACKELNLELIMVAIPCGEGDVGRMNEYGPWKISKKLSQREVHQDIIIGGEGKKYISWLADTLKPYIDHRFRTLVDDTTIIGSSMGGVIASYAILARPEVFHKAAAVSTAYWFYMPQYEKLISKCHFEEIDRFYMDYGQFEGCGSEEEDQWYIDANHTIENWLDGKLNNYRSVYIEGATHNEAQWRKRLPSILSYLYVE